MTMYESYVWNKIIVSIFFIEETSQILRITDIRDCIGFYDFQRNWTLHRKMFFTKVVGNKDIYNFCLGHFSNKPQIFQEKLANTDALLFNFFFLLV